MRLMNRNRKKRKRSKKKKGGGKRRVGMRRFCHNCCRWNDQWKWKPCMHLVSANRRVVDCGPWNNTMARQTQMGVDEKSLPSASVSLPLRECAAPHIIWQQIRTWIKERNGRDIRCGEVWWICPDGDVVGRNDQSKISCWNDRRCRSASGRSSS